MFNKFYKSLTGETYLYLVSTQKAIVVHLRESFIIEIQNSENKICDAAAKITFHGNYCEEITHAQFYSVYFEAIEHLKEFLPDKNKNIFEVNGCADFTVDHDYGDEEYLHDWEGSRGI